MIAQNLESVRSRISDALDRSHRQTGAVRLVAVSKTVSQDQILEAIDAGVVDFGENKVQEALTKVPHLNRSELRWHMIGHLQQNKVKYIYDLFDRVHSVDSVELAEAIHHGAKKRGLVMPILVQVNIAHDSAKYGIYPAGLEGILKCLSRFDGIQVEGLMALVPYHQDPQKSRPHYARLRELRDRMSALDMEHIVMKELSMGMTNDFHIAVEEGATIVRVGTALFGQRSDVKASQ